MYNQSMNPTYKVIHVQTRTYKTHIVTKVQSSTDTVSTGGLAALGVQLKEKMEPMVKATALRGVTNSGGSVEEQCTFYMCQCNRIEMLQRLLSLHLFIIHDNEGSHCTSRVKLPAPLPASL